MTVNDQDKLQTGVDQADSTINQPTASEQVTPETQAQEPQTEQQANTEDFSAMLEESMTDTPNYSQGDEIEGKIVAIDNTYIFVGLGGKQDAVADIEEYKDENGELTLKVGDSLRGYIVKQTETQTVISKSFSKAHATRQLLKEAYDRKVPVTGKVTGMVNKGFSVDVLGARAFCPISQIDLNFVQDAQQFVGAELQFEIIEYSQGGRNIIVSRRNMLEKERNEQKADTLKKLNIGDEIEGRVTRLTNFGAFVDLGGVDGLVHISEMSWKRIDTPSEVVHIGDTIKVKVIKLDGERISLSIRALSNNPLDEALEELQIGDIVACRILRNEAFGSFVEIRPGVEALIPISQMTRGRRIEKPSEVVTLNEEMKAKVIKVDKKNRQISLSIKALQPDPWDSINDYVNPGDVVKGILENVTEFGAFIRIADGVTGLLPKSKMEVAKVNLSAQDQGNEVEIRVSEVDTERRRISLEPVDMPEMPAPAQRDRSPRNYDDSRPRRGRREDNSWRRYSNTNQEVPEDNPFRNL